MISFRVSEREFEMLKTMSESEGARSVSDFARVALCGRKNGGVAAATSVDSFDQLRAELEQLKTYVRRVAEMLEERENGAAPRVPLVAVGRPAGRI
jgi:hypothetical protein